MLLVYSERPTPRLQYICRYLFRERMGLPFRITSDAEEFNRYEGAALCYASRPLNQHALHIGVHGLLSETDIRAYQPGLFSWDGLPVFFATPEAFLPFDLLAAAFYLVSRYEEYLHFTEDSYGRFPHTASLAYRGGFLDQPLVDQWMIKLAALLQQRFPGLQVLYPSFRILPTYDIDMAWSYLYKGWWRNLGGWLRKPSMERAAVLLGYRQDPFDVYDRLDDLHKKAGVRPRYFFLLAERAGRYDKNIPPLHPAMRALITRHAQLYDTGIHPSWQSGEEMACLQREISLLESITGMPVHHSRQHYIRFTLPGGYRRLSEAGITNDYSMGYGSINGFRASVAAAFNWYDLERDAETSLRVHPFCFMDANAYYEQHLDAEQALEELLHYQQLCLHVSGTMIAIWHNNFLGDAPAFTGWKEVHAQWLTRQAPVI